MSSIIDFLVANSIEDVTDTVQMSLRRNNGTQVHDFKIKALTSPKNKEFQDRSRSKLDRKGGMSIDFNKLQLLTCGECIIEPNFKSTEVQDKFGVKTPEGAIEKVLLPGEISELYARISKISGFDSDINEDIEEAKN